MAEAIIDAVAPPVIEEDKIHTGVLLFNRWSYDEVQVIFRFTTMSLVNSLHCFFALCIYHANLLSIVWPKFLSIIIRVQLNVIQEP